MKINKKIIFILTIILISIFILKILFFSNFIDLIKLKNDINNLDGKSSTRQIYGNNYNIYTHDNKKRLEIKLPNKFKKIKNFDYNDSYFKYNIPLSLDGEKLLGLITIVKDSDVVSQFNNTTISSPTNPIIMYNNKKYGFCIQTLWQSITEDGFSFAILTPIDSDYYYFVAINAADSYELKEEDLEALLNI